ncbi:MAG TPA: peroxiredoxin [Steroidobacteraceae bacterium]|nr:peroxiredoxin [Steroidobacteraceae bacterium]
MFARSIRITPTRVLLGFAVLAIVTVAAYAAAPAFTPAEGNAPKPQAGQAAPTFSLVDQNGKKHQLADYKGKWVVVYFYPKDQTPGCTTQACNFTENVFAFRKANAQILGISEDDEASHKEFEKALSGATSDKINPASKASIDKLSEQAKKDIQEHGLPFPLLADASHDTAKKYGVLNQITTPNGALLMASRDTFLIDPTGKVAKHYDVTPDKLAGHSQEVLADIAALSGKKS